MGQKHSITKNRKKQKILNIFLIIFICIFGYSSYNIFVWVKSDRATKKLETELFSEIIAENNENDEESVSVDFERLKEINSDIFAWIKLENTYINYPILQGESDEYYIKKDIYRKYNSSGSIFVDSTTKKDFTDENTVIYGHNMKNKRMFADLFKIYDNELGDEVYIEIYTEESYQKYKVFATYIEEPSKNILKKNFTESEKEEYIKNALAKSHVKFNTEIDNKKEIITLITCNSTGEKRLVVHAIKE